MDYKKIYQDFIDSCIDQDIPEGTYTEKHHILPKHMGGGDEDSNIVKLTYRQHIFAHRVLWKAYGKPQDLKAYMLMSGMESDERLAHQRANGISNVRSGLLDRIRPLANTEARKKKLAEMNKRKWETGDGLKAIQAANKAWRGQNHTEQFKKERSEEYKRRGVDDPKTGERYKKLSQQGRDVRYKNSLELSEYVVNSEVKYPEYLTKKSNRSIHYFVSPEGLKFESPIYAANYYGNKVKPHTIENWCKRESHGWYRTLKPDSANDTI